jgi:Zn-dependent peptidase ImmA (M78 family)
MKKGREMIKDKVFIPDETIERKTLVLLAGLENEYGKVNHPPIPIDKIVERYLDLCIDWDIIDDTDDEMILGCLQPDTKKILMNERHRDHFEEYIGTEAFTKAHEVGHWELHIAKEGDVTQLALPVFSSADPCLCRQQRSDPREIQAEKYAAYLLMPKTLIMESIQGQDLTRWPNLYALKDTYGVTITALTKRLSGLGLIYISDKKIYRSKEEATGLKTLF